MINEYNFSIEKSKDNFNIIKVYKENKEIYIGSKYNMESKINNFIENISVNSKNDSIFLIFGIGSGECIKKLYTLYPKSKIIIFEPNCKLIKYIEQNPKQYSFLKEKKIYLINCEKEDLPDALSQVICEYEIIKVVYSWLLNYDKIYKDEFYKFSTIIKDFLSDKAISRNTSIFFSETWFKTLINNLKYIVNSKPVDTYRNKYKDIPAIIVSAGPSLSKNISELNKINKNMLILSGGRTLKPLSEMNIEPNLIGVVDPGEASYELVKGYINKCNVPLLFYEGTNSDVLKNHNGEKIVFTQGNVINKLFDTPITNLGVGGSIAHTLTMMAILLGCNPIIFIGQDLAYTGEKFHADIAVNQFKNLKDNLVEKTENKLLVEDINGSKVRTDEILDSFRRELETIIKANNNISFIDATEGGAKINGTINMPLKTVIEKYKVKKDIQDIDNIPNDINKRIIKENIIDILKESIKATAFIKNKCNIALKTLEDLNLYLTIKNDSKINKSLRKLDRIDAEIKEEYSNLEILNNLLYPTIYAILSSYNENDKNNIIEKNKFLYESILSILDFALQPIKNTLSEIEQIII